MGNKCPKSSNKFNYIYPPMDKDIFADRVKNVFPSFYLTMVSIIQGVALGFLVFQIHKYINSKDFFIFLYCALSFFIIAVVSYEYTTVVAAFNWPPKFIDVLIPLLLGIFEILPLMFLEKRIFYWLFISFFSLIGWIAYWNTSKHNIIEKYKGEEGDKAFKAEEVLLKQKKKLTIVASIFSFLAFFILFILMIIKKYNIITPCFEIILLIVAFILLIKCFRTEQSWFQKLHEIYGYRFD